jgi:hypothetical protein
MWSNITVEEFIDVYSLGFDELTPTEYEIERLLLLTGEDYSDAYDEELDEALKRYSWVKTFPRGKKPLDNMTKRRTLGQFIDLIHFRKVDHPYLHLDKIVARFLDGDFNDNLTYIQGLPITDVIEHCDEIIQWQDRLIKNYDSLFDTDEDEDEEPTEKESNPFAWEQLIHKLCDGKIWLASEVTALPVVQCFNWLAMEQSLRSKPKGKK